MTAMLLPRTNRRAIRALYIALLASAVCQRATAQNSTRDISQVPCGSLAAVALPDTRVTMAEPVAAGAFRAPVASPPGMPPVDSNGMPAFCRVTATISPTPSSTIKMEVWLPAEGWNGKFVAIGNGGFSGAVPYPFMTDPLRRGYAVAATDGGHEGHPADASFAIGQPEKLVDYAWRAVHEMTVKPKAIVSAHYGVVARRSYWIGCSTGGRQGLKEAQRFPGDYDGISAGAPANNWVPLMAYAVKVQHLLTDPATGLTRPQLTLLKETAIAACDARDGVTDRVIEDPRSCTYDPGTLLCKSGDTINCLTARQVEAVRSIYEGVVNPRTRETLMPGPPPAGELLWFAFRPNAFPIGVNYWRDLVKRDANWSPASLDFDADIARARELDTAEMTTTKSDLKAFFARGGKLLLWHGWTDGMIPSQNSIAYHESVLATTGSDAQRSMRLFMLPGVDHCSNGEGPFLMDALGVIDAWVESGQAPQRIVASRPLQGGAQRTRPLRPYPQVAQYRGQGSTDDERNFECRAPARR